jgi:hypothetical protein
MAESRTGTRRGLESSPPLVTAEGIKPLPPTGARKVDLRTLFFYGYTGITPAMCMRLTNIGWPVPGRLQRRRQHLLRRRQVLLGDATARHPRGTLLVADPVRQRNEVDAADPPALPPGRQPALPTPAAEANADGSTTIHLGPEKPEGVAEGNWIQTVPGKGWFIILRLYSPLASFFDILS